jgi:glutamate dehydrogenase (NAD(P)+)
VSDINGTIYNPNGLDCDALITIEPETGRASKLWNRKYEDGQVLDIRELFKLDVDILVPGARPDVITMDNVSGVKAKMVVEAANIPATREAEKYLGDKGILVVPDFTANAGGVIAGAVELRKGTLEEAFEAIKRKIRENVQTMLDLADKDKSYPREAAERLARERVITAMKDRGRI